ncbi:bifunctional (p)ppGpp synthetase/guanosine-3',5'-bis(diphosphate) 3'-pyrophosphohydrolase [Marinicella sp. S1101]|nr:bifunctional (p)ppGpp synthetase/guanosine-3',5'-bis(diphosphate) 3'-pyrophosphohydrolase [Marinicella marina]MCX7554953.1 bifunctional (p)ppGpp synthetase/guanosine-3',5'-bis(diphosphate) 3'-pyrophosphohydrolase [Marinicella marina]MDJ1141563.1 bifunctional (p)ppGpp synthetase/guanosine-3',5'-bis(diphosphate) 3'-pyrophosphohydrolase [Marinicella marina]
MSHKAVQAAFKQLKEKTNPYLNPEEKSKLREAVHYGAYAHEKQIRKSGEPYITHPITVATVLAELRVDIDTLIAGVLHDTIEDTDVSHADISKYFNTDVAYLVEAVTKLDKLKFRNLKEAQAETFVKMLFAMADDIRVIIIKLSDRLHNMRTIAAMSASGQRRISRETLDVYAPIAERMGLKKIQHELEDHAFKALHPNQYKHIIDACQKIAGNRQKAVDKIRKNIKKALLESGMHVDVSGRQKSPYSTYKKLKSKQVEIDEIHDLFGVRIVVRELNQCYLALGIIHNLYPPNENGFKDYIAVPKQNGYQSLHSVVTGPFGMKLEVQIRTEEMDQMSEAGVAAHWLYKHKDAQQTRSLTNARSWLNSLLNLQKDSGSSLEFYENFKGDLGVDEIYVFTPKGDIVQLPSKSSVLDFAFAIHTSVGSHAESATVNGNPATLSQVLDTGDLVSIKTAQGLTVTAEWLRVVVTSKARTAIRKELKDIKDEDALILGHRMLDRALDTFGYSFEKLDQRSIKRVLKHYQLDSMNELLKAFAFGELLPSIAARKLMPLMKQRKLNKDYQPKEALTIDGTEGSILSYPNCCLPLPGDDITGYLSPTKGVVIHRSGCINLTDTLKNAPERKVFCSWSVNTNGNFKTSLEVDVVNRTGVLASLAAAIANEDVNIVTIDQTDRDTGFSLLVFTVEVTSAKHAQVLMDQLQSHREVLNVKRVYHERNN